MKTEIKNIAVKSAKLAGVTCVAAGAIALVASGAAVKAAMAGGAYLKETARKILEEKPETPEAVQEETGEESVSEAVQAEEVIPEEAPEAGEAQSN